MRPSVLVQESPGHESERDKLRLNPGPDEAVAWEEVPCGTEENSGNRGTEEERATASGGKNFFSYLSSEQNLSFSDCCFSAMALQISQGYFPLNVMLTASVKGTICE